MPETEPSDESEEQTVTSIIIMFEKAFPSELPEPSSIKTAQDYVAGFATVAISKKLNCQACWNTLIVQKGEKRDGLTYFSYLQRGGLREPTTIVKQICFLAEYIYDRIYADKGLRGIISNREICPSEKDTVAKLVMFVAKSHGAVSDEVCECGQKLEDLINKILSPIINTVMKGTRNLYTDKLEVSSKRAKKKEIQFKCSSAAVLASTSKNT